MSDQETIDALNERTAANDVTIGELNQRIIELQSVDVAALQEQVNTLTTSLVDMTKDRDANAIDNAALRTGFSSYMSNSAAGQLALLDFNIMLAQNQVASLQGLIVQLQGQRIQMAGA